jgi:hypothetical protein
LEIINDLLNRQGSLHAGVPDQSCHGFFRIQISGGCLLAASSAPGCPALLLQGGKCLPNSVAR